MIEEITGSNISSINGWLDQVSNVIDIGRTIVQRGEGKDFSSADLVNVESVKRSNDAMINPISALYHRMAVLPEECFEHRYVGLLMLKKDCIVHYHYQAT